MLFGGKYAHNTWWTDEPRQIKGINLLPMAPFSIYLGRDPAYVKRNVGTLPEDTKTYLDRGKGYPQVPKDSWQDIFAKYLALADPAAALAQWDRHGSVELGDTRTHTLHWMLSLNADGPARLRRHRRHDAVRGVRRPDGRKTYLAFNADQGADQRALQRRQGAERGAGRAGAWAMKPRDVRREPALNAGSFGQRSPKRGPLSSSVENPSRRARASHEIITACQGARVRTSATAQLALRAR